MTSRMEICLVTVVGVMLLLSVGHVTPDGVTAKKGPGSSLVSQAVLPKPHFATQSPTSAGPEQQSHVMVRRSTAGAGGASHCSPTNVMSTVYELVDSQLAACKDVVLARPETVSYGPPSQTGSVAVAYRFSLTRFHSKSRILGATFFVTATTSASAGTPALLRSHLDQGQGHERESRIRGRVDVLRTPDPSNPRQPSFLPFLLATSADGSSAASQSDYCLAADVSNWVRGRVGSFPRTSEGLGPALSLLTRVDYLERGEKGSHSVNVSQPFIVFNIDNSPMGPRCNRWEYKPH